MMFSSNILLSLILEPRKTDFGFLSEVTEKLHTAGQWKRGAKSSVMVGKERNRSPRKSWDLLLQKQEPFLQLQRKFTQHLPFFETSTIECNLLGYNGGRYIPYPKLTIIRIKENLQ